MIIWLLTQNTGLLTWLHTALRDLEYTRGLKAHEIQVIDITTLDGLEFQISFNEGIPRLIIVDTRLPEAERYITRLRGITEIGPRGIPLLEADLSKPDIISLIEKEVGRILDQPS